MNSNLSRAHPILSLSTGELELITQLVLASGSLKELAQHFRVSYPTIRSRLDQVIAHLRSLIEEHESDSLPGVVEDLVNQGEVTATAAQAILEAHRQELHKQRAESGERRAESQQ
jgi:hypothetical protein